jgi:hypothetical protein
MIEPRAEPQLIGPRAETRSAKVRIAGLGMTFEG